MGGAHSSKTPRRNSRQPIPVATPSESQGYHPAPPPHSEGGWLCNDDHKYPIKSSENPIEMCNEILERHDENTYRQLKEEITFLMVVAGLILAIVAAFTVESYKSLQEDKQDTMSDLLVEVVRLLNDPGTQGKAQLPKPFAPKHHAIVVNQLWFLSVILNLMSVAIGTFCLQWISALSRGSNLTEKSTPSHESLALRQLRYEGLVGWGVLYAPEALLFMVQLSIGLFVCGLVYFLWNVNKATAIPVLVVACLTGVLLHLINLVPFLQPLVGAIIPATLTVPQCPYKSPTSWLMQSAANVLPYIIKLIPSLWVRDNARLEEWLKSHPLPFTGFDWKKYDETCLVLRASIRPKSSYFQSGLLSALDHSTYERDAMDIISSYPGALAPIFETAEDWEKFSQQKLSNEENRVLNHNFSLNLNCLPSHSDNRWDNMSLLLRYGSSIRADFLRALILQILTQLHKRLAPALLHHRAELYIRVKNSTEVLPPQEMGFGQSLECPCQKAEDVQSFDLELKFQFLLCVRRLIKIRRFNDHDIMAAAVIVKKRADEKRAETLPNQPSPSIANLSNQPGSGTTSSTLNDIETGGQGSATQNTGAEDHQFRPSFDSLCHDVKKQVLQLGLRNFKEEVYYYDLRHFLSYEGM